MKRLFYLTNFSLIALFLISCEKEIVAPESLPETSSALRATTCPTYSYQSKTGVVQFGTPSTAEIIVAFDNSLTLAQKAAILSKYKPYRAINYEVGTESGDLITVVSLKSNTTCSDVEQLLQDLKVQASVIYALPTFASGSIWGEFIVQLSNSGSERNLNQLVAATNTRIVGFPDVFGPKTYVISVQRNSTGNVFDLLTYFNASSRIAYAEPNGFINPIKAKNPDNQVASQAALNFNN